MREKVRATEALEGRLSTHYSVARPAESQNCPVVTAGVRSTGEVGRCGLGGVEFGQIFDVKNSLLVRSKLAPTSQAPLGGALERRRTCPV